LNKPARALFLTVLAIIVAIAAINYLPGSNTSLFSPDKTIEMSVTDMLDHTAKGHMTKMEWQQSVISGEFSVPGDPKPTKFTVDVPSYDSSGAQGLWTKLIELKAPIKVLKPPVSQAVIGVLSVLAFPLMVILLLYFFVFKPAQMGGNQAMSFGRSRAKRVGEQGLKVTFEDVAGIDEAKQELWEIVDFLKNTKRYTALGAKIPKGILLTGPPGVGKTHLARAIAGEAGVPFFHISGSDFVEMFVGVGAARVRDLFETAKAHRPSLIFIDEIDAVGRQRGAGLGGGHDEREQTLNQLLVEMDGFDPNSGVIMIAATNRPDVLDPAILRPGRFDRQIVVDLPDAKGREAILKIHAKGKPLAPDVDLSTIAKRTPSFSGADLANSLNEAALLSARHGRSKVGMLEMEEALDRVMVGPARKSRTMIAKEREITAYHEAGHAVVGELLEHCDPVHKVTILPRGMALGITWSLPDTDKVHVSKSELLDDVTMSLAGLVAEEVIFGERWTGASSDLQRVTRIARAMICEYGMSDRLGTLAIGHRGRNPFLGRDVYEDRDYSEEVARMIDEEVRNLVDTCHDRATEIIEEKRDVMDELVKALLERETLDRDEFLAVLNGAKLPDLPPVQERPADDIVETESVEADKAPQNVVPPRFEPGPA
jgi:cell division protease FtsH